MNPTINRFATTVPNRHHFHRRNREKKKPKRLGGAPGGRKEEKRTENFCTKRSFHRMETEAAMKGKQQQLGLTILVPAEKTIDISVHNGPSIEQGSTSGPEMGNTQSSKEVMDALKRTVTQKAFSYSANLANLLPTGTLLAFQVLVPIFSNDGDCNDGRRYMTAVLLIGFGIACFMVSFTDSFKVSDGKIYCGLTTPKGLWTFQYVSVAVPDSGQYKLSVVDFVHAVMSLLVFITVTLFNENVVRCFWPHQGEDAKQVLRTLPIGIGFFASVLFVVFPTTRHGIGYPVTT